MHCPACETNHKKSAGMTCTCGYRFRLVPAEQLGIGDHRMVSLFETASAKGTFAITRNQLYALWARKARKSVVTPIALFVLFSVVAIAVAIGAGSDAFLPVAVLAVFAFFALVTGITRVNSPVPAAEPFFRVISRWVSEGGRHADLLVSGRQLDEPPPQWQEPDVYDYGVRALVVVERDELVDLLVRNELHATEHALVLSASGYPSYLLPVAHRILQENPELPVYVVHDALPPGEALGSDWWSRFAASLPIAGHPLVDLGLTTDDIPRIPFLKPLQRAFGGRLPADILPWGMLAPMFGAALLSQVPFQEVLAAQGPGSGTSDTSSWSDDGDFG